jgi:hypothetical protein
MHKGLDIAMGPESNVFTGIALSASLGEGTRGPGSMKEVRCLQSGAVAGVLMT